MGWNYSSISKFQRCNRWSLGMDKYCYLTLCWACGYLSMLELKLNHVSKGSQVCDLRYVNVRNIRIYFFFVYRQSITKINHGPLTINGAGPAVRSDRYVSNVQINKLVNTLIDGEKLLAVRHCRSYVQKLRMNKWLISLPTPQTHTTPPPSIIFHFIYKKTMFNIYFKLRKCIFAA